MWVFERKISWLRSNDESERQQEAESEALLGKEQKTCWS